MFDNFYKLFCVKPYVNYMENTNLIEEQENVFFRKNRIHNFINYNFYNQHFHITHYEVSISTPISSSD